MTRAGYVIAPQAKIEITTDEYGDVTLVQNGNSITIRAANVATMAEILIDIDNGRHASDDDPIDDDPDDDEPPTTPVNTNAAVNTDAPVNKVNSTPDRKVYMREYMRKRRHRNGDAP